MARISKKQYKERLWKKIESKYNNKKIHWFDSKKEYKRYCELCLLERAWLIKWLQTQPKFVLQEPFKYKGQTIRGISYYADFKYLVIRNMPNREAGKIYIEDVKWIKTPVYNIKKKLLLSIYRDINFLEI